MPVSTVLGRKTVSNILEYLKKMLKGGEGTAFNKDIKIQL